MKNYTIYIQIYNDLGELCDKKLVFPTLEDMTVAFWKNGIIDSMISDAALYAIENSMVVEEIYDSKEDAQINEPYIEDLSENSPLNNPANFAN